MGFELFQALDRIPAVTAAGRQQNPAKSGVMRMPKDRDRAPTLGVLGARRPNLSPADTGSTEPARSTSPSGGASDPQFLSVAAAGEALAVSDDAIYDLLHRRDLPSLRIGRRRVIPRRAVELVVEHLLEGFDPGRLAARLSASQG